jgi:hypothetical protein
MNNRHPLDEVFRHKLQGYEAEAPMHLWDKIAQQRDRQPWLKSWMKQHPPLAALAGALVVVGILRLSLFMLQPGEAPALSSFPILAVPEAPMPPLAGTAPSAPVLAELSETRALVPEALPARAIAAPPASAPSLRQAAAAALAQAAEDGATQLARLAAAPAVGAAPPEELASAAAPAKLEAPALLPSRLEQVAAHKPGFLSNLFSPEPRCAHFGAGPWRFYVDALVSPDLAFRNLQSRNPEYEHYLESRNETESYLFAFSGALRLSAVNQSGLAIRSGINYSQISEKFDYFSGSEQIVKYISRFDQQGNVIGTDTIIEVGTRHKVTHNTYRMLDIPFLLGYEVGGNKLKASVNAGAYLNLLFRQRGDFLSPQDMTPVSFDSSNPNAYPVFRQQVGLGWYGSVGLAFQAGQNLQFLVEPHFKLFPRPVTLDQFVLEQRYLTTGIFVGLRAQL